MLRIPILLIALSSVGLSQTFSFQPKQGSTWTRTHSLEMRSGFDHISMTVDGQTSDETDFEIEVVSKSQLIVEDTVLEWKPGGPRHLERLFVQARRDREAPIKLAAMGKTTNTKATVHGESPLQGQRVDFRSKAPGEDWLPSFAEGCDKSLPSEWLTDLDANLDFSLLLPPSGTKTGERWSVDAEAFLMALDTGQGMHFDFGSNQVEAPPLRMGGVVKQPQIANLWDSFEGCSVRCKLKPQRKAGHLRFLEIEVSATFDGEVDLVDWAMASMETRAGGSTEIHVRHASQNTVFTGAGVYLWDLDRRVMHSFGFRGDARFVRDQELMVLTGDEETSIDLSAEGRFEISVDAKTE